MVRYSSPAETRLVHMPLADHLEWEMICCLFALKVSIEGNIASGKTSFLDYFSNTKDVWVRCSFIIYKSFASQYYLVQIITICQHVWWCNLGLCSSKSTFALCMNQLVHWTLFMLFALTWRKEWSCLSKMLKSQAWVCRCWRTI